MSALDPNPTPNPTPNLAEAQQYLREQHLDGWLLEDFQHNNPVFWQAVGGARHSTRRAFLLVPPDGTPTLLIHFVDANRYADLGWRLDTYVNRADLSDRLAALLAGRRAVAMEYSPNCALPVVGRVDAGTIEQVRSYGVEVISSADLIQFAVARWSPAQAATHKRAAAAVVAIAHEAFDFVRDRLASGVDELAVRDFILERFAARELTTDDPPIVGVNEHSADPHFAPTPANNRPIRPDDWLLLDIWAREAAPDAIYGDTTWVGYVGASVPAEHRRVFDVARAARDTAVRLLCEQWAAGQRPQGWEIDKAARVVVDEAGLGHAFTHRLGHSIGTTDHGNGVNLDDFETHDTRAIIPGVGFSVEPGIYLKDFGVRLEVDVYVDPASGPTVTTPAQDDVVLIR